MLHFELVVEKDSFEDILEYIRTEITNVRVVVNGMPKSS
jgi:hypothetical protein|tara:strand:+ start:35452 stop:35568 length:117 start_codon:yes stop_codon:yes gene_type:complete